MLLILSSTIKLIVAFIAFGRILNSKLEYLQNCEVFSTVKSKEIKTKFLLGYDVRVGHF